MMSKYDYRFLDWDTEFFGVNSSRINLNSAINIDDWKEIISLTKNDEFITISNVNNLSINNILLGTASSAFLTDINVQFEREIKSKSTEKIKFDFRYENLFPTNEQVVDIATQEFVFSRFYNDPNLDENKTKSIYRHWVNSSFNLNEKYFLICCDKDSIVGFILFKIDDKDIVIELIAVSNEFQHSGVGKSLIESLVNIAYNNSIRLIKVGTQINNIPAVNFYLGRGFKLTSCHSMYHLWNERIE